MFLKIKVSFTVLDLIIFIDHELKSKFSKEDIISILPNYKWIPEIVFSELGIQVTDFGFAISSKLHLENPFKVSIKDVRNVQFQIRLDDSTIVIVRLKKFILDFGYQDLDIDLEILLSDPLISPIQFRNSLSNELQKIIGGQVRDLDVSVAGPIKMDGLQAIQDITNSMSFKLPINLVLDYLETIDIKSLISLDKIRSILEKAGVDISVSSSVIETKADLVIPFDYPIPRRIVFPYTTSLSLGNHNEIALKVLVDPLLITRSNHSITVSLHINIEPVNSKEAAIALASSINPLLDSHPSVSICSNEYLFLV